MAEPFFWGQGGAKLTPEQLALARAVLARKKSQGVDTSPVGHWTAGAARVVDALGDVFQERRLNNQQAENDQYNVAQTEPLIAALTGGSAAPVAAAPVAASSSALATPFDASAVQPEIKNGIVETASALGIDPVDLGTAISYETGGTFDPTKAGPTTQWGQHKGLIQFGEPQAKQYGVDWNNPVGSQLGANGAVANYLRSTGVRPGMGLMDIYSAINAGGVGRYNASDANNGGAPGTVADKVNQQMSGHRAKAMALLGAQTPQAAIEQAAPSGYVDPMVSVQPNAMAPELPAPVEVSTRPVATAPQQSSPPPAVLAQALRVMADPRANENTKAVAQALIQRQQAQEQAAQEQSIWQQRQAYQAQQQASDPLRQLQIQKAQAEVAQMQNPNANVPDSVRALDLRAQRSGLQQGTPEYNTFMQTGGARTPPTIAPPPTGFRYIYDANQNPVSVEPVPGSPQAREAEMAAKKQTTTNELKDVAANTVVSSIGKSLDALNAPGLPATGTVGNFLSGIPESNSAELRRQLASIKSNITLDSLQAARAASPTGAALGAVSDKEGELLANKLGALDPSSPNFQRDLLDVQKTYLQTVYGVEKGEKFFDNTMTLRNAKAAIAKGANPEAVMKKLVEAGIDPEGIL